MITKQEVIECFLSIIYLELLSNHEIEPLKFIFHEDAFSLFNNIKDNPTDVALKYDTFITQGNINYAKNNNVITDFVVDIPDASLFFDKLTTLINMYNQNKEEYKDICHPRSLCMNYLRNALWLKMTPYDFLNIYDFLDKQISFIKNDYHFDKLNTSKHGSSIFNTVDTYMNYEVFASKELNSYFYETMHNITMSVIDKEKGYFYQLPSVHYEISDDICYIYALQNMNKEERSKKIERDLYKLNKGIENPLNHPSFVLALTTFIKILHYEKISSIEVPLLEPLNYSFHKIAGDRTKEMYDRQWSKRNVDNLTGEEKMYYNQDKYYYDRLAMKEDFISEAKTDNLVNLFMRIEEQYGNIDIDAEDYKLKVKVR